MNFCKWLFNSVSPLEIIHTDPDATPEPRQGFDRHPDGTGTPRPLEDMFPYLPRSEFKEMMEIEPWGSAK